ncbi:hypothetical protein NW768_011797 [Fusarium equiseti]|uniref:Protein kinase domain-containing protein n=1 Tax=Fusarium equiseti TaxID=61235 RepID=A0ABQ8QWI5_FUSEQ|nr:hypothetical protein NW768_011797 [Fusarium equiseti]
MADPLSVVGLTVNTIRMARTTATSIKKVKKVYGGGLGSQSKDLRRIERQVASEFAACRNLFQSLLMEVFDDEELATRMLDSPSDEMWNDLKIQSGIHDLMGQGHADFTALCLDLGNKLMTISRELDQISEKHSWRSKRLQLSVKPKELEQQLRDVSAILGRLQTLVREALLTSVDKSVPQGFIRRETAETSSKVQKHAFLLREMVSQSKLSGHDVFIYPLAITTGRSFSMFTLLFRRNTIEATSEFGWRKAKVETSRPSNLKFGDPLTESRNSQSQTDQARVPLVHFEDSPPISDQVTDGSANVAWVDSPTELARHFSEAGQDMNQQAMLCLRYPPFESSVTVTFRNCGDLHRLSLKELLKANPAISIPASLTLAVELTKAVLCFHQMGLVHSTLKSESVWFAWDSNKVILGNLFLSAEVPGLQSTGKGHSDEINALDSIGTSFGRACLMLGIILVEVLLGHKVSPWDERADIISPGTVENARVALDEEIRFMWGPKCSDAVKRCLLDFGRGMDREDEQQSFLNHVLKPLEEVMRQTSPGRPAPSAKTVLVEDWDRAVNASKDTSFPVGFTEGSIATSDLSDPTVLRAFRANTQAMLTTCENIRWLNEALSNEVRSFRDLLQQLEQFSQSITPDSSNTESIHNLARQCLRGISTIPLIYDLGERSNASRKALERLQIQLRGDTLELQRLLYDLRAPNSPTMSSTTSASGADTIFDGDSFTLSSRSSFVGRDEIDLQYVNSRGLASEILHGLCVGFDLTPFRHGGLAVDSRELSSKLRQIIESYCVEVQGTDQEDALLPQPSQHPWYQKACSMVMKEIEFLVEKLASVCQGHTDAFTIHAPKSILKAPDTEEEMIPAFAVMDFLVDGKAFGRLRLRMRRLVKQDIMETISDEVLRNLPLTVPGLYNALFHVRWDVFDYITNELDGATDISQVLTVTGEGSNAYASRCADYLQWRWPDSKYDICSHIQQYLKHKTYEHSDATLMIDENKEGHNGITVNVVGAKETITELAQQLAWLTAAYRSGPEGVALSDVDFIATKGMQFFIEAGPLTNLPAAASGSDICWHRLVRNVAIAHGFPIPPRSNQVGLELPYEAMLKLSQTPTLLVSNGRLAYYGYSSFLFPMNQSSETNDPNQAQQSVQWHFEASDDREEYFDCADYLAESQCIWANDLHQRTLATSRHFVGYCRVSEFCLATSSSNFLNLQETSMPDASTTIGARIENVTAGTGGLGFGTVEFESNIRYAHSIINTVAADEYLGTMDTVERMSMILWDCEDECGWLVPAQALLLHMAHVWVKSKRMTPTFRHAKQGLDYLQEVDKILREDRKKVLIKEGRDDDSDFELRHLIMRIWNDIRGCMLAQQSALREDKGVIGYQAGGISGWEVTDFLIRPALEFFMKQDKRGPSDSSWKGLAAEKNIPVLFCKGAGEVIKTTPSGFLCANCRLSLKHQSYLIASLICLGNMAQKYGGFRAKTRLTAEWGWQPTDEAALFQEHCQLNVGSRCNERLQKLITFKEGQHGTNLNLPANGVVVFGRTGSKVSESTAPATAVTPTPSAGKRRISKLLDKFRKK